MVHERVWHWLQRGRWAPPPATIPAPDTANPAASPITGTIPVFPENPVAHSSLEFAERKLTEIDWRLRALAAEKEVLARRQEKAL